MANTPIVTIDYNGASRPTLADCLDYYTSLFQSIYGQDIYIDPDSMDGQFIGLLAQSLHDINGMVIDAYNSFSPSTAQGVALARNVKINGIVKKVASYSTVDLTLAGVVGTIIHDGQVRDEIGNLWTLPSSVVIPPSGEIVVTATCATIGDVRVSVGDVNIIETPQVGWQTAVNLQTSVPGDPIETDAQLRIRQSISAALPAVGSLESLISAIAAIPNVKRYRIYENSRSGVDPETGITGHSIAVVVEGGGEQAIVDTIAQKKGQGIWTYGPATFYTTTDRWGQSKPINFSRVLSKNVTFKATVKALQGFTSDIEQRIVDAIVDYTNGLNIGDPIQVSDALAAARLLGTPDAKTFRIQPESFVISDGVGPYEVQDISCEYNEAGYCESGYVVLKVI